MIPVTLLAHSLSSGGAERVLVNMAEGLVARGFAVSVVTLESPGSDFYRLPAGVERVALDLSRPAAGLLDAVTANVARVRRLRAVLCDLAPRVVVSFVDKTNVLALIAGVGLPAALVVTEHCDPDRYRIGAPWRWLRRLLYPRADRVVTVSRALQAKFAWAGRDRVITLHNPVRIDDRGGAKEEPRLSGGRNVVAMGRLVGQKGFDRLLDAFAKARAACDPEGAWHLTVFGEGPDRVRLARQAAALGIGSAVSMPGNVDEPWRILRGGDFFVLSSRFEGYPTVLCEALLAGLPVISFDCPTGPSEIVVPGTNGLLVADADVAALAEAMQRLMTDDTLRETMRKQVPATVGAFAFEAAMDRWSRELECLA